MSKQAVDGKTLCSIFLCSIAALTANAEKIQPVGKYLKTGLSGDLLRHVFETGQYRICNLFAFQADDMRMGPGLVSDVTVASIRKSELQNFAPWTILIAGN